jgi:hypothetical protein
MKMHEIKKLNSKEEVFEALLKDYYDYVVRFGLDGTSGDIRWRFLENLQRQNDTWRQRFKEVE